MEGTKKLLGCFGIGALCMALLIGGSILFNKKESGSKVNHANSANNTVAEEPSKSEAELKDEVKSCVEAMYSEVFNSPNKGENFEARFLTRDFYNTYVEARNLAKEKGEVAIDHSLWHQAQDWGKMSIEVTKVEIIKTDMISHIAYSARVYADLLDTQSKGVTKRPLILLMNQLDGAWKIDDMRLESQYDFEKEILKKYIKSATPIQSEKDVQSSSVFTINDAIGLYNSIFLANTNEYGINEYQLRIPNDLSVRLSSFSVIRGVEIERTETYMAIYYVDCSTSENSYPKPTNKETAQWLGVNEDGEVILQVYSLTAKEALVRQLKALAGFRKVNDNRYVSSDATVTIRNERGGYVFNIKETK